MTILVWALGTGATNVETRYRLMSERLMMPTTVSSSVPNSAESLWASSAYGVVKAGTESPMTSNTSPAEADIGFL